mmetsp:Transcript_17635/g.26257  ORF Transcript_17635/g.26257 Transcript_17635/m.26257 type:complete len:84 (-) Transcript_17635:1361-1612(-)
MFDSLPAAALEVSKVRNGKNLFETAILNIIHFNIRLCWPPTTLPLCRHAFIQHKDFDQSTTELVGFLYQVLSQRGAMSGDHRV